MHYELTERDRALFWAKVDRAADCWLWTGQRQASGYGTFERRRNGSRFMIRAHRVAYEMAVGAITEGMDICHHCDNPPCVRPDHLFVGDARANGLDMVAKGRNMHVTKPETLSRGDRHYARREPERLARGDRHGSKTHPGLLAGERNPQAKLTEEDVRAIRARFADGGVTKAELARHYGVTKTLIGLVILRKSWPHIA